MYLSPLWSVLTAALAFGTMSMVLRFSLFLNREIDVPSSGRVATIDGLRAYLALGVFLTHALSIRDWSATGVWNWPPSTFYILCGTVPVTLFFMLTGFLFWSKAIRGSAQLAPVAFYTARFRRLAPLYFILFVPFLLLVATWSGFVSHASAYVNARAVMCWAAVGICGHPTLNGIADVWIANPPIWTLQYEWYFYLALPCIAWCATPFRSAVLAVVGLLALHWFPDYGVMRNFLFGGLAAFIVQRWDLDVLRSRYFSVVALVCIGMTALTDPIQTGFLYAAFLMPALLAACAGNSFFGLLSARPARALGVISYSIYLGHCLVLQFTTMGVQALGWMPAPGSLLYWIYIEAVTVVVVLLSAASFRFIEFPFLAPWNVNRLAQGKANPGPRTEPGQVLPSTEADVARV